MVREGEKERAPRGEGGKRQAWMWYLVAKGDAGGKKTALDLLCFTSAWRAREGWVAGHAVSTCFVSKIRFPDSLNVLEVLGGGNTT